MDEIRFEGQQEGERILYEARPDKKAVWLGMLSLIMAVVVIAAVAVVAAIFIPDFGILIFLTAFLISGLILLIAWMMSSFQMRRNVVYITDRRVMRFSAVNPWTVSSRSLFWDEVVKIKTLAPNWLYRMMNVGYVTVHARLSDDDVDITNVSYYKDLGNYMDKILYLFKNEPEQLRGVRGFVPKPKGQRY